MNNPYVLPCVGSTGVFEFYSPFDSKIDASEQLTVKAIRTISELESNSVDVLQDRYIKGRIEKILQNRNKIKNRELIVEGIFSEETLLEKMSLTEKIAQMSGDGGNFALLKLGFFVFLGVCRNIIFISPFNSSSYYIWSFI